VRYSRTECYKIRAGPQVSPNLLMSWRFIQLDTSELHLAGVRNLSMCVQGRARAVQPRAV